VPPETASWNLADLRGSDIEPIADPQELISEAISRIADEGRREKTKSRLAAALLGDNRPARPDFPDEWRAKPNVMFEPDNPSPELMYARHSEFNPFTWGERKWATADAYDEELGNYLGELACTRAPELLLQQLASRANLEQLASGRRWPTLFAARLTAGDCPPAKALPDNERRKLEQLAVPAKRSLAAPGRAHSPHSMDPCPPQPR
jgi:hypothetical protein